MSHLRSQNRSLTDVPADRTPADSQAIDATPRKPGLQWRPTAKRVAWAAAAFALLASATLAWTAIAMQQVQPLKQTDLRDMRAAAAEGDVAAQTYRQADQQARADYARLRYWHEAAWWLLAGSVIVLAAAGKFAYDLGQPLPTPGVNASQAIDQLRSPTRDGAHTTGASTPRRSQGAISRTAAYHGPAAVMLIVIGLANGLVLTDALSSFIAWGAGDQRAVAPPPAKPIDHDDARDASNPQTPTPGKADAQRRVEKMLEGQWLQFHGGDLAGRCPYPQMPTSWTGEPDDPAVRWRVNLAGPGVSSPIVVAGRVIVTSATSAGQTVEAFEAATGRTLWQASVGEKTPAQRGVRVFDDTVYAACTPASDGQRIVVMFASGDLACFDLDGHMKWQTNLGVPEHEFGYASSPLIHEDHVILQYDMGDYRDLIAVQLADGKTAWRVAREAGVSWASPLVLRMTANDGGRGSADSAAVAGSATHAASHDQIITISVGAVIGHDAATGRELWRLPGPNADANGSLAASPIAVAGRIVYIDPDMSELIAVEPGDGSDTQPRIAWRTLFDDGLAAIPTPTTDGKRIYAASEYGGACFDAATGSLIWKWEHDDYLPGYPVVSLVDDAIWLHEDHNGVWRVKIGDQPQLLGKNPIEDSVGASPAFAKGVVFIRTKKQLIAFTATTDAEATPSHESPGSDDDHSGSADSTDNTDRAEGRTDGRIDGHVRDAAVTTVALPVLNVANSPPPAIVHAVPIVTPSPTRQVASPQFKPPRSCRECRRRQLDVCIFGEECPYP